MRRTAVWLLVRVAVVLLWSGCVSPKPPVRAADEPPRTQRPDLGWLSGPRRAPSHWTAQGVFDAPETFPLHDRFRAHRGIGARMAAFRVMQEGRPWWVVDTRYAFASERDAAHFLQANTARLAEGRPILDIAVACFPGALFFGGPLRHPSTDSLFFAFNAVGKYRHYVYSFLAAVEIPENTHPAQAAAMMQPSFQAILQVLCRETP